MSRLRSFAGMIAVAGGLAGCSGGGQAAGTGGAGGTGGVLAATGGTNGSGSGGTTGSGGTASSGGAPGSGGLNAGTGGLAPTGGTTGSGGRSGSGGSAGTTGSGGTPAGGSKGSGGAGNGGHPGTGGATGGSSGRGGTAGSSVGGAPGGGWVMTWSDEFNGASGTKPDASKWTYDTGMSGWGNNELENYTRDAANASMDGSGNLVITAIAQGNSYTSARIKTQGLFSQGYGRFEARIQLPRGQGIWPAFWAMGADMGSNPWPACGEMDIMENVGKEPAINHGSMHGPGYSGGNSLTASYKLASGALADDFHLYAIEWETNVVRFYVDDNLYETRKNTDVPSGSRWVFDHPFFLLLNVAVGGTWPGNPDSTSVFPQKMLVDYVRVYKRP